MSPARRIAFYSHDSQGLGHLRRNLELASCLVRDGGPEGAGPDTEVLLIGSAAGAERLPLPPRTTFARVPRVVKGSDGHYAAADPRHTLAEVLRRRGRAVTHLLESFEPDLVVVDKLARGLHGELDPALRWLGNTWTGTRRPRLVLGLRDVLDDPRTARAEWEEEGTTRAVLRYYDEVWVYGDPAVFDVVTEYRLPPAVASRLRYTGYLARGRGAHDADGRPGRVPVPRPYVLCTVGGGSDGRALAESFARSALPAGHEGVLVTGPHMGPADAEAVRRVAAGRRDVTVHEFLDDPVAWIESAAAVVSMGGYNTVCEVLASRRPALVVPRTRPRLEQTVRARRLASRTGLAALTTAEATPEALARWMRRAVWSQPPRHAVDLAGLERVPRLADALLAGRTPAEVDRVGA